MIEICNKMPPVGSPCIRTGDMPDSAVMRALQRKEVARDSMRARFTGKPNGRRAAFPQPCFFDVLGVNTAAGSSFGTFTTAKTVLPTNSLATVPAGYWTVGRYLEIEVWGGIGSLVTTPGTITFQVMLGPVGAMIIVFTTGTMQLNATAHTNLPFYAKFLLLCQVAGSGTTAKFMGSSFVVGTMFTVTAAQIDGVNSQTVMMAPKTAMAQGTGFDSTVPTQLDFWTGFSISDAANTIKIEQYKAISWI